MSKTKNREHSETEYLKGQIRKLESENRQLKKRLRKLDKKAHLYEDLIEAVAEEIEAEEKCEKCKQGIYKFVDLKYAKFMVCDKCQERKKI